MFFSGCEHRRKQQQQHSENKKQKHFSAVKFSRRIIRFLSVEKLFCMSGAAPTTRTRSLSHHNILLKCSANFIKYFSERVPTDIRLKTNVTLRERKRDQI